VVGEGAPQYVGPKAVGGHMVREQLLDLLVEYSYDYADQPKFRLSSGRESHFYIDCKPTTMRREGGAAIAAVIEPLIPPDAQAVGGLTMGADPIAYAIRDLSHKQLDAFVVRKDRKQHGLGKLIEGPVKKGMRVVVVDDVVTTGGSTIKALAACRDENLIVVAVIVLVDREEDDGLASIRKAAGTHVPVQAVFTKSELHDHWLKVKAGGHSDTERPRAVAV